MKIPLSKLCAAILLAHFFGSLTTIQNAYADHPNEGNVTLSSLLKEAQENSLEIKEAQKQSESTSALRRQAISGYLPHVSIDGGSQTTQYDDEKSNGVFAHLNGTVNLYRGGKDKANQEIQSAEEDFQKVRAEKTKARIIREVSAKYYELLYLSEGIALKEDARTANKNQMALAQKKKNAGFTSQADVLEFELRDSTLASDINFLKLEETIKERELARLVGRSQNKPIHVKGHLERIRVAKTTDDLLKRALAEREDLKEAEKNLRVSELGYKSLFGDYLPRIDLDGKFGKLATDERVFTELNNYSFALKVSIPIFSGLETKYGRHAKFEEIAKNELSASRLRQEIRVQLENALTKLRSIEERLDLEEKNIERSKQYYEISLSEYRKGVKNSPDVAGAAERLSDARLRNLEYRKNYELTRIELAETIDIAPGDL